MKTFISASALSALAATALATTPAVTVKGNGKDAALDYYDSGFLLTQRSLLRR